MLYGPIGGKTRTYNIAKLEHDLREPTKLVDIVSGLACDTLLRGSKFADADYISIYDPLEVNIYDAKTTKKMLQKAPVPKCWRCPNSGLWLIPLQANIKNVNTDTLLLDSPDGRQYLNSFFTVPTTESILYHLQILLDKRPDGKEAIHHVYDLPSIEPAIRYLRVAAVFPAKATWLEAIWHGNFLIWPHLRKEM